MTSVDLYHDLDLDRSKSSAVLAAELDHRLRGVSWEDKSTHEQLTVARKILGDATKRTMYDQRLADPAASIDINDLRGLAAQSVHPATAPTVDKIKALYRGNRPAQIASAAAAAVVVLGLGFGGVAACTNNDSGSDDSSVASSDTGSASEGATGRSEGTESEDSSSAGTYLSDGEEVIFTTGEEYEYEDGHTERSPDGGQVGLKFANARAIDIMSEPDPSAPADHPDAKGKKVATAICVDVTRRLVEPEADADTSRLDTERGLSQAMPSVESSPYVYPVIDGAVGESDLNVSKPSYGYFEPDSDEYHKNTPEASGANRGTVYDTDAKTITYAHCVTADEEVLEDGDGSDLASDVDGIVVTYDGGSMADPDREYDGWKFDL